MLVILASHQTRSSHLRSTSTSQVATAMCNCASSELYPVLLLLTHPLLLSIPLSSLALTTTGRRLNSRSTKREFKTSIATFLDIIWSGESRTLHRQFVLSAALHRVNSSFPVRELLLDSIVHSLFSQPYAQGRIKTSGGPKPRVGLRHPGALAPSSKAKPFNKVRVSVHKVLNVGLPVHDKQCFSN